LESIFIQIRLEISTGGAKLDFNNTTEYSESEAIDAFNRMSQKYGWN
jgi:hypothetical protein